MKPRFVFLVMVIVGLSLGLAAPSLAEEPSEGRAGRAEIRFLEGMIDHHQMALDMAGDCLVKASTDPVETLCQNVIDAQSAEIEMMQNWLLEWYNIEYFPMAMMDMGISMGDGSGDGPYSDPAMTMGMMAGFNRLEGADYDVAWMESMIDHHDDALHMSERILTRAEHTELRDLAQAIIDAQTAEIEMMEGMITELGG